MNPLAPGLQQQFIDVIGKKAIRCSQVMNEVCYEMLLDQVGKNLNLALAIPARRLQRQWFIHNMAFEKETTTQFVHPNSDTWEILTERA